MSSTLSQRPIPGQAQKEALMAEAGDRQMSVTVNPDERPLKDSEKFQPPSFTVKELLDCIPAHCFQRSAIRSGLYIVQDVLAISGLVWCWFQIDGTLEKFDLPTIPYHLARSSAYTFISVWIGLFATGLWIIAHECGHQAFSTSKSINNAVGWVLHSALLVPYHSWRISHGKHHAATGHLTRDEVFVPRTREDLGYPAIKEEAEIDGINVSKARQSELREAVQDTPMYTLWHLVTQQLFGWPAYLIRNASGQKRYPFMTNHFQPSSFIFKPEQADDIVWSDFGLVIVAAIHGFWGYQRGFKEVALLYGLPYLQVNHWLVGITFLQHTDPELPHYSANKWTFARGALCTMDRDFLGPIGGYVLHGICETHVAHHTSSKIPHYHAWEATEALKNYIGDYYMKSDENFLVSLYKNYRDCRWIEATGDIVFYKNAAGLARKVGVDETGAVSDSGVDMSADLKK